MDHYGSVSCRSLHFSSSLHFVSGSSVALNSELYNYYFTRLNACAKVWDIAFLQDQYLYFMSHCALRTLL